jgi:hypothetical protein
MKNKKGNAVIVGIIILVVVIVAGTVGYLSAKKTIAPVAPEQIAKKVGDNPASNLQTYRNEKYGFEFQYPNGWIVREDNFSSVGEGLNDSFQVAIYSGDKKESFNVTVSDKAPSAYIYEGEKKKVIIDGLEYTAYLFPNGSECFGDNIQPEQCKEMDIPLQKNGKWFVFGGGGEYTNLLSDQFLKIISTFKFTNSGETATWQTYRNEKYGFEFKYPNNWQMGVRKLSPQKIEEYEIGSDNAPIHFNINSLDADFFMADGNQEIMDGGRITNPDFDDNERVSFVEVNGVKFTRYDWQDLEGKYEGSSSGRNIILTSPNFKFNGNDLFLSFEWEQYPGAKKLTNNDPEDFLKIVSTVKFIK